MGLRMWQEPEVTAPAISKKVDTTASRRSAIRRRRRGEHPEHQRRRDLRSPATAHTTQELNSHTSSRALESGLEQYDLDEFPVDGPSVEVRRALLHDAMRRENIADELRSTRLRQNSTLRYEVAPRETLIVEGGAGATRSVSPEYEGPFPIRANRRMPTPLPRLHEPSVSSRITAQSARFSEISRRMPFTRNFAPARGLRRGDGEGADLESGRLTGQEGSSVLSSPYGALQRGSRPRSQRNFNRHLDDMGLYSTSASESRWNSYANDGLGDRRRSLSPDELNAWSTIHATIMPDERLPSAESSFTSATASSFSSERASRNTTVDTATTSTSNLQNVYPGNCDEPSDESEADELPESENRETPARWDSAAATNEHMGNTTTIDDRLEHLRQRGRELSRMLAREEGGAVDSPHWPQIHRLRASLDRLERGTNVPDSWWQASGLSAVEASTSRMNRERL